MAGKPTTGCQGLPPRTSLNQNGEMSKNSTLKPSEKKKRVWNRKTLFFVCARVLLGGIFVIASLDKILHPGAFAEIIHNYQLLPDGFINLTAIILPWLELLLGLFLIIGLWLPGAALLGTILLLFFWGSLLFNLFRGVNVYCGCFSTASEAVSSGSMKWYALRDGIFVMLAFLVCFDVFFKKKDTGPSAREE
jgi:uncharacterized membrane protein YphA (DoxX/SURF4 family)